jgi:hypothetical protein
MERGQRTHMHALHLRLLVCSSPHPLVARLLGDMVCDALPGGRSLSFPVSAPLSEPTRACGATVRQSLRVCKSNYDKGCQVLRQHRRSRAVFTTTQSLHSEF